MPTVFIPSLLQNLTNNKSSVEVPGSTVHEVIHNLEKAHPGIQDRLIDDNHLRANISVAVDGEISPLGLLEEVKENSEIHFVAAIKGGQAVAVRGSIPPRKYPAPLPLRPKPRVPPHRSSARQSNRESSR